MKIFKKTSDLQLYLLQQRQSGITVGFVPTMGALHDGHLSLCAQSKIIAGFTVASIFVNPTQFNDKEDLEKYPRTVDDDIMKLISADCDVLFLPDDDEIYPAGLTHKNYPLGSIENKWEGAFRPGHFQGVCEVVDRLFTIVKPDYVFFGQKDYQQCVVIKKLLDISPHLCKIKMNIIPTMREENGLAMSSRNMRLSEEEKKNAAHLYETLFFIKENIQNGNNETLLGDAQKMLVKNNFKPDYLAIVDANTMDPISDWDGKRQIVVIAAAFLGNVRLIDNIIILKQNQQSI